MSDNLPRVIELKLAVEPRRLLICFDQAGELAKMARLPKGLPDGVVAHQFLNDFKRGALRSAPVLFSAQLRTAVENP